MGRGKELPPEPGAPEVVAEELGLLEQVRCALAGGQRQAELPDYDAELLRLREAVGEEKLSDDQAMLVEQMDRLEAVAAARGRYLPGRLDPRNPYFAHMRLEDERGTRDLLLGKSTFSRGEVRVVDWRNAPISQVFYRYREGELYAEEIAARQIEGRLAARRTLTIVDGQLVRVAAPQGIFLRGSQGWQDVSARAAALRGGAGSATRPDTAAPFLGTPDGQVEHRQDKHLPEIAALLDAEQFGLLTRDGEELLVVAGSAGSGKTTVALHRLAYLTFHDPKRFRPGRSLVLVFGRALQRYIARVLPALGVHGVEVRTLRDWAQGLLPRHFEDLPLATSEGTPAAVVRFKTHRLLVPWLAEAARVHPRAAPVALFDLLFTDRVWLAEGVARHSPGAFSERELQEIQRWCADQHFRRVEGGDEATDEPPMYDEEDAPILLRLHQLLLGPLRQGAHAELRYDHLVIDEAQDFSPLELQVLLDTVRGRSVTLAGDTAQRVTDNDFRDWGEVLETIGQDHAVVEPLRVSYRSTRPIMELAHRVLGPLAPAEPAAAARDGLPVELLRFGGAGAALTFLADALQELARREPGASVAVLTRSPAQADEAHAALARGELPRLRRVRDQEFTFTPGVEVTDVVQTKGLEFDYVVLVGVDADSYPATESARHLLHVGLTRAIHQAWLLAWGRPSPLLPRDLPARLAG
ncbi:MAG TPA: ATP-binding domain-containing protein [Myxococcota bacterium]|nr:ATP-binding domain-containing protein [Myxococcota bacterium]HRY92711.1 ATP-binding domain-containing protein [Myxococcota bacterium]